MIYISFKALGRSLLLPRTSTGIPCTLSFIFSRSAASIRQTTASTPGSAARSHVLPSCKGGSGAALLSPRAPVPFRGPPQAEAHRGGPVLAEPAPRDYTDAGASAAPGRREGAPARRPGRRAEGRAGVSSSGSFRASNLGLDPSTAPPAALRRRLAVACKNFVWRQVGT